MVVSYFLFLQEQIKGIIIITRSATLESENSAIFWGEGIVYWYSIQ